MPFTQGGAEFLISSLISQLRDRGHLAELIQLPFSAFPKEHILESVVQWRALDIRVFAGKPVDLVIGTKFPSYCVRHHNKVNWVIHQHRQAYELYGTRFGDFDASATDEAIRQMIYRADKESFFEAKRNFTISETVSRRLLENCAVPSRPLLPPPPLEGRFRKGKKGDYILSVGRLCSIKRPDMLIQALPSIDPSLHVKVVGVPDQSGFEGHLAEEIRKNRVGERVQFLGKVSEEELLSLYADAFAVYYAPHDEDYGFVTLEALSSAKPVVTAKDSGGTLAFIRDGENGVVCEPTPQGIASGFQRLLNPEFYEKIIAAAPGSVRFHSWEEIVTALIGEDKHSSL